MLDPWTALSLAAGVAQFIDFGVKVISLTKEVKEKGSSLAVVNVTDLTKDLISINQAISTQATFKAADIELKDSEQALDDLATKCKEEAQGLIHVLDKLSFKGSFVKRNNFAIALRTIWKRGEIDALAQRLGAYREQLALRILVIINSKSDAQLASLSGLERSSREIVEVVTINNQFLKSAIESQGHNAGSRLHDMEASAKQRHEETVAAILTLSNGESRTITREPREGLESAPLSEIVSTNQNSITYSKASGENGRFDAKGQAPGFRQDDFSEISRRILNALHFRVITERQEQVVDAHARTCQWIFQDPEKEQRPWTNFVKWLEVGQGCYWVNGKAGSGKSTLMKHIYSNQRTRDALKIWAGEHQLLIGSFFFWNAGTALQKSHHGLLRSLLFELLEKRKDLVPVLFPGLCRSMIPQFTPNLEISFAELKKAFKILLKEGPGSTKICLFIDGLDEYQGNDLELSELAELLLSESASGATKYVISSRPIPACVHVFSSCATLRLQDLTSGDMMRYIEDKLVNHRLMQKMEEREHGTTSQLIDGIASKASGVFLWVMLVVRSLLNRLQNFDRKEDLLRELDRLPADLEALYKHMLGSMSAEYQRQAFMLIRLVLRNAEVQDSPITLLELSYAEEEAPLEAIKTPIKTLSTGEAVLRCEATDGRIRSRCCGLLETHESTEALNYEPIVTFLHRTVIEFFKVEEVRDDLRGASNTHLDLDELLLSSSLYALKRRPTISEGLSIRPCLLRCLKYSQALDDRKSSAYFIYLDEIYKVMQHNSNDTISARNQSLNFEKWAWDEVVTAGINSDTKIEHPFLLLLTQEGLGLYLSHKLHDSSITQYDKNALLVHSLLTAANLESPVQEWNFEKLLKGIKALLECGADPNEPVKLTSPWTDFLILRSSTVSCEPDGMLMPWRIWLTCVKLKHQEISIQRTFPPKPTIIGVEMYGYILEALILAQADFSIYIKDKYSVSYSAFSVVERFCSLLPIKSAEEEIFNRIQQLVFERRKIPEHLEAVNKSEAASLYSSIESSLKSTLSIRSKPIKGEKRKSRLSGLFGKLKT